MGSLFKGEEVNPRTLAWEIRKLVGVNLGGYNETAGVLQDGDIQYSSELGTTLNLPDTLTPSQLTQVNQILDTHDNTLPLPGDFPTDPVPTPSIRDNLGTKIKSDTATLKEIREFLTLEFGL